MLISVKLAVFFTMINIIEANPISRKEDDNIAELEINRYFQAWKWIQDQRTFPQHHRPCKGNKVAAKNKEKIFYAWKPLDSDITHLDVDTSKVTYVTFRRNQPKRDLINFTMAVMSLTLRRATAIENSLNDHIFLRMGFRWTTNNSLKPGERELFQTQELSLGMGQTYLMTNISEMVRDNLMESMGSPIKITFTFQVYQEDQPNGNRRAYLDFRDVFDVESQRPTVYLFMCDLMPEDEENLAMKKRSRREAATMSPAPKMCQRHDFFVTPEQVAWHGVVFPAEIDLGRCAGQCPFPLQDQKYNFTLNTFLQDRYWKLNMHNLPSGFQRAYCVGVEYKPIYIAEYEEGTNGTSLTMEKIDDLSIKRCGCRA